jgi:hypothetical protein
MSELDSDGNGEVSLTEFAKFWKEKFTGSLVAGSKLAAMMAQFADARQINGVAYHPDRYVDPEDEMRARCWALFEEIDGNHDNHISYIEFINWWKRMDKEEHHGQSTLSDDVLRESQEKFQSFDSNDNGTIDRDELAGLIRALDLEKFVPSASDLEDDDPPLYIVNIHTGGHPEGGTDAGVYLTLFGEDGDTGKRELTSKKASDSFNRGQINTFKLRSVDVGAIQRIRVGHDNKSTGALADNASDATGAKSKSLMDEACKWQLDKIVVKKRGADPVTFGCAEWLDINSGDKMIERDLFPGERVFENEDVVENPMATDSDGDTPRKEESSVSTDRKLVLECGSGLKNADTFFGGKSDPYAIVSWNGVVLGKTKTIDNTLHPIWNEEFTFDIGEEGLLKVEVYDHDVFFKDDLLGKVEMKLGGKSNPRGMLSRQDYSFQEPEEFPGNVTLRVEHGSHRLSTEEQLLFRDRFMQGETMRARRDKHVFQSYTRLIVLIITLLMTIGGSFLFGYSVWLLGLCDTSPFIAYAYLIISPIIALSSAFGFYGALRVKADTEAAKGTTEGNTAHGADDDGLQTTGQVILEMYFHMSLITIVCWLWLIIETFAVGTAGADGGCHSDHDDGVQLLAYGGIAAILVLMFCMHNVVKICSFFEILQSLAEGINVCLMLLGFAIMMLASLILKQTLCLTPADQLESQSGNMSLAISMLVFGILVVCTAFFGFVAAVHESMSHLLQHAIMLGTLTVLGIGLTGVLVLRGVDSLIDDNCVGMLGTLPATFFEEYASCSKYKGYTELWNGTGWQLGIAGSYTDTASAEGFTADLGDMAICNPKTLNSFAWEVNPFIRSDGSSANLYGCLNADPETGCCEAIKDKMHAFDYGIAALFVLLFLMMLAGIYASLYLRYETTIIGHILIHPYAKRIFIGMKLFILFACIGMPFLLTGSNCGGIETADLDAQKNLLPAGAAQTSAFIATPSCFNGILDGMETDIDCGRDCDELCGVRKGCEASVDCSLGLLCVAQDPLSSECWDRRCVPGQAAIGLTGICAHPTALELCANTEMDYRETDTDCGGPDCRGLDVPKLCNLDQQCRRASDCKGTCTGTLTSDGTSSCTDVAAFVASGAESDCPTEDGCTFHPNQCIDGACKSICNSALDSLIESPDNTCGGECEACADTDAAPGLPCAIDSDCASNRCYRPDSTAAGECVSYFNGRQDGSETGSDCGGDNAVNFPCELGASCAVNADCRTGNCGGTCSGQLDSDNAQQCSEVVAFVNTGAEADCPTTDGCTYVDNKCAVVTPLFTCSDTETNFMETDLDCGGVSCVTVGRTCATGNSCLVNADCEAGACSPDRLCFGCDDNIRNGDETDVDCGGPTCNRKCSSDDPPQQCLINSDCQSTHCFGSVGDKICVSYFNSVQDGDETDVDCGGSAAEREGLTCDVGEQCAGNFDCSTSVCGGDGASSEQCVARDAGDDAAVAACGDIAVDLLDSTACDAVTIQDASDNTLRGICAWSAVCRTLTPLEVCTDGQQAFPETDIDCGGEACRTVGRTCADGLSCEIDGDCEASSSCHGGTSRCVSCNNGVQDGDETDVDCGGPCSSCASTQSCARNDDCISNMCFPLNGAGGVCTSCNNGITDGTETDLDCGGSCGKGCEAGLACQTTDDCAVGVCDGDTGPLLCRALLPQESCANGIQDREETDSDCGGAECATLPKGCPARTADSPAGMCNLSRDCDAAAYCYLGTCASCTNGFQDGDETDVDCGGSNGCAKCQDRPSQFCIQDTDCLSNLCYKVGDRLRGQCVSYQNGEQDGDETCIDGGGTIEGTCGIGEGCHRDVDCSTNKCQTALCPNCADGFVAGTAGTRGTDVGTCDPGCTLSGTGATQTCTCEQWNCRSLTPTESCNNGELDGTETDLDCGGASCATVSRQCSPATVDNSGGVTPANSCLEDRDCDGSCSGGICISCSNGLIDGDETDVDCGGSCGVCNAATANTAAQQCRINSDCDTMVCYVEIPGTSGMCASDSNGIQDGDETDIDCGGTLTENTCEVGSACEADSDCDVKCQTATCPDCNTFGGVAFVPGGPATCGFTSCVRGVDAGTCDPGCTLEGSGAAETCTCTQNICRDLTPLESCNNGVQDGAETDLDCGGEACASIGNRCNAPTVAAPVAQFCLADRDCNGWCLLEGGEGTCVSCSNEIQDGDESDVDCGGSCGTCSAAKPMCTGTASDNSVCAQASAFLASGAEADCPAGCDFAVADAQLCGTNDDCTSSRCYGISASVPSPCVDFTNQVQDGDETCVDGGGETMRLAGSDGALCGIGEGCAVDGDCSTHKCDSTLDPPTCRAITPQESCNDGVQGPDESDVDCGGPRCSTVDMQCETGRRCLRPGDCGPSSSPSDRCFDMTMSIPQVCNDDSSFLRSSCTCVSCGDGAMNGDETDVDCGGGCRSCPVESSCSQDSDCDTNNCVNSACAPTAEMLCVDGLLSANDPAFETDVDCGGPVCGQCNDGDGCLLTRDCSSHTCTNIGTDADPNRVCTSCGNGIQDGLETDIDCGSDACPNIPCRIDMFCKTDIDCGSGNCDTSDAQAASDRDECVMSRGCGKCMAPTPETTCNDSEMGQSETCVDGGGDTCLGIGKLCPSCGGAVLGTACSCSSNTDCLDSQCSTNGKCFSCTNGALDNINGDETDVDCGGPCSSCAVGQMCAIDADCSSGSCTDWGTGLAASDGMRCSSCSNGFMDGLETDIDCGAAACGNPCDQGLNCLTNEDCSSQNCDSTSLTCLAPSPDVTCSDNAMGELETCTDGGGSQCRGGLRPRQRCDTCIADPDTGLVDENTEACGCSSRSDCSSRKCFGGFCFACNNGLKDGSETGVDCGGDCSACPVGQGCSSLFDCSSRYCVDWSSITGTVGQDLKCADCTNGIKDEIEAGIDCGLAAGCQLCNVGVSCLSDADCNSHMCDVGGTGLCIDPSPEATCGNNEMGGAETCVDGGGDECTNIGRTCPTCAATCTGTLTSDPNSACAATAAFIASPVAENCPTDDGCAFSVAETDACSCSTDADCTSQCSSTGYCFSCTNGIQDGDETDIDCGGPCTRCAVGQTCTNAADCSSDSCTTDGANGLQCTSCTNGLKDGLETDVDCGKIACPDSLCGLNQECFDSNDCASSNCDTGDTSTSPPTCQNPTPDQTCTDDDLGQQETCVDGGGAQCQSIGNLCPTCADAPGIRNCGCTEDGDCQGDGYCDTDGTGGTVGCFSCTNDQQDGSETDIDCGGGRCNTCAVDQGCSVDSDCSSSVCTDLDTTGGVPNLRCTSCSNGVADGLETDIDCGMVACGQPCQEGQSCDSSDDCVTGTCGEQCQALATDVPADIESCRNVNIASDSGQADCEAVMTAADGAVAACSYTPPGTCAPTSPEQTCNDGIQGQLETDVDCGGVACTMLGKQCNAFSPTGAAQMCAVGSDCDSSLCATGWCASCANDNLDGLESDVDCGGPDCSQCSPAGTAQTAQQCSFGSDCSSLLCHMPCDPADENACPGAATCDAAFDVYVCTADSEWTPSAEGARPVVTAMGTCVGFTNGVADGLETDVDCGASALSACTLEQTCQRNEDCSSGNCDMDAAQGPACAAPDPTVTCNDGALGELETDIDCGGPTCRGLDKVCATGQQCEVPLDCASSSCGADGLCSSCGNDLQDGDETATDCGGGTCAPCEDGKTCLGDSDCQSGICSDQWQLPGGVMTCIRPGSIAFGSAVEIDLQGGASVNRALWIEQQNAPVHPLYATQTAPCNLQVRLSSTNGTHIQFEEPTEACTGDNAVGMEWVAVEGHGSDSEVLLSGSLVCVSELLAAFGMDTSCTTPWGFEGDHSTGDDDLTSAQVTAEITDQSQCAMYVNSGESSVSLGVNIIGRIQVEVIGYVLPAKCKSENADSPDCKDSAIDGATITGAVHPCHLGADTCVDTSPTSRLTCTQLVEFGMATCDGDITTELGLDGFGGQVLSDVCRQTCGSCPDVTAAFETISGQVQGSRGTVGPLREGAFEMTIAFSPTDAKQDKSALVTITKTGYAPVTLTVPLSNGVTDVGNVYLPEEPPVAPADIQGVCIDYFAPPGERGETSATLENGIGWGGRVPAIVDGEAVQELYADGCPDCTDPPCACVNVNDEFVYPQANDQMAAKTLTCALGNSTSTQYVTSNGELFETTPQPMLLANPEEGFIAVLSWADLSKPADFASIADIEFYSEFGVDTDGDGVDDGAGCRLDVVTPACGGGRHLQDGPFLLPTGSLDLEVLAEAISLDQLYQTVYTFYAYNRGAIQQGITCSSASDEGCTQIVDMTLELFGPSGKVLDMRPYSQSMAVPYTRLFCVDARVSPPVVRTALATSTIGAPPRCTECPC